MNYEQRFGYLDRMNDLYGPKAPGQAEIRIVRGGPLRAFVCYDNADRSRSVLVFAEGDGPAQKAAADALGLKFLAVKTLHCGGYDRFAKKYNTRQVFKDNQDCIEAGIPPYFQEGK